MGENKQWILFGAGDEGVKLFNLLEKSGQQVYAFVDNNINKIGSTVCDRKVLSFNELIALYEKYKIVISVSKKYEGELEKQLLAEGIREYFSLEDVYNDLKFKESKELSKFKNIHKGEKCFIVGTGPSLRLSDLELINSKGIITFASNRIFKMYEETTWRPDYYFVTDYKVINQYYDEIVNVEAGEVFVADIDNSNECQGLDKSRLSKEGFHCFTICYREQYEENSEQVLPKFSLDASRYVIDGGLSVTYSMLQWAVYMGFTEIYLIGVDFHYSDKTGLSNADHIGNNYLKKGEIVNPPNLERCGRAYKRAEMVSKNYGVKIYNATRGGKLEVFERVDLDYLLKEKE